MKREKYKKRNTFNIKLNDKDNNYSNIECDISIKKL